MKKWMALLMAVLMMAVPVFGMAETAETAALTDGASGGFFQKYAQEGQRQVFDIKAEMTDTFYGMLGLPEEIQTTVKDLLAALTFEFAVQSAKDEGLTQGSLRILGKEDAVGADITAAIGGDGLYFGSTFLGDQIVCVTKEQIKELMSQLQEQAAAQQTQQSGMTPEQQEQLQGFIEELRKDPQAAILKLVGQPDLTGVQTALLSLASVSDPQAVTEQPEDVPFDAAVVQTITVKREDLTKLTSELGKVLYAMPVVRQFGGSDLTEEKLIEKLNSIPEGLAEDVEVRLYTAESGVTMIAVTELKIKNGEKIQPLKLSVLIDMIEDGMHAVVIAEADQGEENGMKMTFDFTVGNKENSGTVDMEATVETTENGTAFVPMQEIYHIAWNKEETVQTSQADVTVRIRQTADAEPVGIVYNMTLEEKDLGDHAEMNGVYTVSMENVGEMGRFTITGKTDLAEAYIVTSDAVKPLDSQEAGESFMQNLQTNAMSGLLQLMNVLPENAQQMLVQLINNSQK